MKVTARSARWIALLAVPLLRTIGSTWRFRTFGHPFDPQRTDVIFAFHHGDMLIPAVFFRRIPCAVFISQHGDGELIAQALRRLGKHVPVRGSSTRGGARAYLEMVREYGGRGWAITPDGPRGPRGRVHEGAILLASASQRPITAAGYAVSAGKRLRSWDGFVIPYPLARIATFYSAPLHVPPDIDKEQRLVLAGQLEERLRDAEQEAAAALASW